MDGLAIVASFLLVPIVAVRIAVPSLLGRRIDVAAILEMLASSASDDDSMALTRPGSSSSATSAGVERWRTRANRGRAAAAGASVRASGRAATMRLDSMLEHDENVYTNH